MSDNVHLPLRTESRAVTKRTGLDVDNSLYVVIRVRSGRILLLGRGALLVAGTAAVPSMFRKIVNRRESPRFIAYVRASWYRQ
jgi:hypothetical protein